MREVFLVLHLIRSPPRFQPSAGRVASAELQRANAHQMARVLINSFGVTLHVLNKKAFRGEGYGDAGRVTSTDSVGSVSTQSCADAWELWLWGRFSSVEYKRTCDWWKLVR